MLVTYGSTGADKDDICALTDCTATNAGKVRYRNRLHTLEGTLETLGVGVAERPGRVSNNAAGSSRNGGD